MKVHSANAVAENAHAQVDSDGHHIQILDAIIYCAKGKNAVDKSDMHLCTNISQQRFCYTTSV